MAARWLGKGTALFLAVGTPVLAQEAAEPARLDEIIVTAQKREERLIETPQSITALAAEDLARLDAVQFRDFANTVPALSFTTAGVGQTQVSLRGVTAGVDIGPTVGVYVDDVPTSGVNALSMYSPQEVAVVEAYQNGGVIRVYTRWFIEHAAARGYQPLPM